MTKCLFDYNNLPNGDIKCNYIPQFLTPGDPVQLAAPSTTITLGHIYKVLALRLTVNSRWPSTPATTTTLPLKAAPSTTIILGHIYKILALRPTVNSRWPSTPATTTTWLPRAAPSTTLEQPPPPFRPTTLPEDCTLPIRTRTSASGRSAKLATSLAHVTVNETYSL